MSRNRKREVASFRGIEIKVQRADFHRQELDRTFQTRLDGDAYKFVPEVRKGGSEHIYRVDHPPADDERWGLIAGDSIHNLRTAFDHLAWQLVISAENHPSPWTKFPIYNRPPTRRTKCLGRSRAVPLRIAGGIDPVALKMIEDVQPYNGRDVGTIGRYLSFLNELDILDKHKQFILTTAVVERAVGTATTVLDNNRTVYFTGQPLKHEKVVARVSYDPPLAEPDPDLRFIPTITLGRGMPLPGEPVRGVLWALFQPLSTYLTTFRDFFPNFPN